MEAVVFIVILINAVLISIFTNSDFSSAIFAAPIISLLLFPFTGLEITILYILIYLIKTKR
jgi:hypothetical protein